MKNFFMALLVLLAVSSLAFAAPPRKFATVNAESAAIHATADESAAAVATVKRGTVLEVDSVAGPWVKVRTEAGETGFVKKASVVPGKKTLAELGALPAATPTPAPTKVATATPKATPTAVAARTTPAPAPTPDYPVTAPGEGARESRTGLAVHAGPVMATNSYRLTGGDSSHREGTRYFGLAVDVDYWLFEALGTHVRVATARGTMSSRVSDSTAVSGIGAEIREVQIDLLGRYVIGSSPSAPSILGGLGFHTHQVIVDSVKVDGNSVGPVSQSYQGPVIGLGGDLPLGGPSTGIHGRVEYWLAPTLTEPDSASGSSDGASGLGAVFGGYTRVTGKILVEATVEYQSFEGRFKGDGFRFNEPVRNARSTDRYTVFALSGSYRF